MTQIRLFTSCNENLLEEKINTWLRANHNYEIKDIKISTTEIINHGNYIQRLTAVVIFDACLDFDPNDHGDGNNEKSKE